MIEDMDIWDYMGYVLIAFFLLFLCGLMVLGVYEEYRMIKNPNCDCNLYLCDCHTITSTITSTSIIDRTCFEDGELVNCSTMAKEGN
jgi:hypothetical protein